MTVTAPAQDKVEQYLARFEGSRAAVVHAALVELRDHGTETFIVMAELAWEVHEKRHWKALRDPQGRPYQSEDDYFSIAHGLAPRHADNFQRVGRMIAGTPPETRARFRLELCDLGISKAVAIAPALEQRGPAAAAEWIHTAKRVPVRTLRARVSRTLPLKPHGVRPPLMRFITMLAPLGIPEDEAQRVYILGTKIHGSIEPKAMLAKIIEAAAITWRHR